MIISRLCSILYLLFEFSRLTTAMTLLREFVDEKLMSKDGLAYLRSLHMGFGST